MPEALSQLELFHDLFLVLLPFEIWQHEALICDQFLMFDTEPFVDNPKCAFADSFWLKIRCVCGSI